MMTKGLEILIVEDDPNLGQTLLEYLATKGHQTTLATTFQNALSIFTESTSNFQIVLADIGLPDGDGIELGKMLRNYRKNFVLLFLSALNDPETKLQGLEIGAEDYITKPFDLRELTLRLERILRTSDVISKMNKEIKLGPLVIHFDQYEVVDANGVKINLGQKECAILELLYERKNEVVSRDEILENIWGESAFPSNRTVDNYIVKLRKWTDSSNGEIRISSIRGIGYKLEV